MVKIKTNKIILLTWKRFGAGAFIMVVIASCFMFLGIFTSANMLDEKSMSYELQASAESVDDEILSEIVEFKDVLNATPIIDVPYTLILNNKALEAPLQGIQDGYLDFPFSYGVEFESSSAMPYIVLNISAAEELIKDNGELTLPSLISRHILLESEINTVTAKISGIFEDGKETPKAYMSLSSAKNLLLQGGNIPVYSMVYVRCLNAGKTESVTNFLSEHGLVVQNMNTELETEWEIDSVHIIYLFISALIALFGSILLLCEKKKTDPLYGGEEYETLMALGFSQSDLHRLNRNRMILFICFALIVGFAICFAIKDNFIFG